MEKEFSEQMEMLCINIFIDNMHEMVKLGIITPGEIKEIYFEEDIESNEK
jgi:hypothetical protein